MSTPPRSADKAAGARAASVDGSTTVSITTEGWLCKVFNGEDLLSGLSAGKRGSKGCNDGGG